MDSEGNASRFLRLVYNQCLNREPDQQGADVYLPQLINETLSWESFFNCVVNSPEYAGIHAHSGTPAAGISPRVCFVHIEKTAGTSFHDYLSEQYSSEEICPERYQYIWQCDAEEMLRYRLYSGHFSVPDCCHLPADTSFVTLLRSPVDRILSLYYFWRSIRWECVNEGTPHISIAKTSSLSEFLLNPSVAFAIDNVQVYRLQPAAEPGEDDLALWRSIQTLHEFASFGLLELYGLSVLLFADQAGFPLPSRFLRRLNAEELARHPNHEPVARQPVDRKGEEALNSLTRLEFSLYNEAVALFCRLFEVRFRIRIPDRQRPRPTLCNRQPAMATPA